MSPRKSWGVTSPTSGCLTAMQGQQDLAGAHQVCLAHVLRNVQYAIDSGDTIFAPTNRDHLRWASGIGRRRHNLKDSTW